MSPVCQKSKAQIYPAVPELTKEIVFHFLMVTS